MIILHSERIRKMKRFKKVIALVLAIFVISSFAGCVSAPQSQSKTFKISEFTDNGIKSLCTSLNKDELIPAEATDMQNEVIGAVAGYRFVVTLDLSLIHI